MRNMCGTLTERNNTNVVVAMVTWYVAVSGFLVYINPRGVGANFDHVLVLAGWCYVEKVMTTSGRIKHCTVCICPNEQ